MKINMIADARAAKKTLKYSIGDGAAYAGMLGLTQDYITPFALALKATVGQIGLLTSIPNLAMAFSQLAAPRLTERAGSRLRFILSVVFLQALIWPAMVLIPFLYPGDKVWWLIALFTAATIFGALGNPAWGSLMADLVPETVRGKYFGFRGRVAGLVTLVFFFIGGALLDLFAEVLIGFAILLAGAGVMRGISWYFLTRMQETPPRESVGKSDSVISVLKDMRTSNLGKYTAYIALLGFATSLSGPFTSVYMLRELKFSYLTYVLVLSTMAVVNLLCMTFWGSRADRAGNIKVIRFTAVLIPFVPILWLFAVNLHVVIFIQVLAGFAWSGYNLATSNFVYDAAPPEKRTHTFAIYNASTGVAVCLGALTGGVLASNLPPLRGSSLLTLFLVSGLLRTLVSALFLPRVREVRQVGELSVFRMLVSRLSLPKLRKPAQHRSWWDEMVDPGVTEKPSPKNLRKNP